MTHDVAFVKVKDLEAHLDQRTGDGWSLVYLLGGQANIYTSGKDAPILVVMHRNSPLTPGP